MFQGKGGDNSSNVPKMQTCISFHASLHTLSCHVKIDFKEDWKVDTVATDHMSPHLHLFQSIHILKTSIKVDLPDGTSRMVTKIGQIQLHSVLVQQNVFYVRFQNKSVISRKIVAFSTINSHFLAYLVHASGHFN